MKYFTLLERRAGRWTPQFGDYDRETVADELESFAAGYDPADEYRIVTTKSEDPAELRGELDKLNADAAASASLDVAADADLLALDMLHPGDIDDELLELIKTHGIAIERGLRMGACGSDRDERDTNNGAGIREIAHADAIAYRALADAFTAYREAQNPNQEPTR